MIRFVLLMAMIGFSSQIWATPKARVLPFAVWKQKKIDEAQSLVTSYRVEVKKASLYKRLDSEGLAEIKKKLYHAELNVGLMKELSGNDYLVLYVYPQFGSRPDALASAAKSLKNSDMVDILTAYHERVSLDEEFRTDESAPIARFGIGR